MKPKQLLEAKEQKLQMADEFNEVISLDTKALNEDGTFEGWASIYGNVDRGNDIVMAGAFKDCLANKNIKQIKFLSQHCPFDLLGVWEEIEDRPRGLWVKGRFFTDTQAGNDAYIFAKGGALDGLSIGYRTIEHTIENGIRKITKADLAEISLVTFPMNDLTRLTGVKSDNPPTIRELEGLLTRDAKLSKQQAKSLLANGYKSAFNSERDAREDEEILNLLNKASETLRA